MDVDELGFGALTPKPCEKNATARGFASEGGSRLGAAMAKPAASRSSAKRAATSSKSSPKRIKVSDKETAGPNQAVGSGSLAGFGKSPDHKRSTSGKAAPVIANSPFIKKEIRSQTKGDNDNSEHPKKAVALDRKARKELTETRKKRRKPNYDLEKEVVVLWEKTRQRNIKKEDRSKLISEILKKMMGKLPDMALNHIMARALQTCLKYCRPVERDAVYEELRPQCLALAKDKYAYHIVIKMMDNANKAQLQQMLSMLHGNVVALLRHPNASPVVEHAYTLANATQKQELLAEFYSPEFRLFKGMNTAGKGSLVDYLATEPAAKQRAVLEHITLALQPILEKGIIDHTIIHRAIVEYLSVSKKSMVLEIVQQLSGALLVRMLHTRDGAKVGVTCVMHGNNKERKKIVKGMKGHVAKIARDEHGSVVLLSILDVVDDTKVVNKIIVKEVLKELKDLTLHKNGRRVLLHLLAPRIPRYFPPDVLAALEPPPLASSTEGSVQDVTPEEDEEAPGTTTNANASSKKVKEGAVEPMDEDDDDKDDGGGATGVSKKDSSLRRSELLVNSGLAKDLAEVCRVNAKELLQSQWGTDVVYEVAMGGVNGELWQTIPTLVMSIHKEIADLATLPPHGTGSEEEKDEHVMEQYFSSRTIRRLILDSQPPPEGIDGRSFSTVFWLTALEGKCKRWAQGHSAKVVSAYMNCRDATTKEASKSEIQALVDTGLLKTVTTPQRIE